MAKRLVEWCKPNFHNICGLFTLAPGVNEVDEELVDKALENWLVKWHVEQGTIKLSRGSSPDSLARLKPVDALALVKRTVNRDLLVRWAGSEKRKQIADALETQIDLITPKAAKTPSGIAATTEPSDDEA